jgi:hypothetical protein
MSVDEDKRSPTGRRKLNVEEELAIQQVKRQRVPSIETRKSENMAEKMKSNDFIPSLESQRLLPRKNATGSSRCRYYKFASLKDNTIWISLIDQSINSNGEADLLAVSESYMPSNDHQFNKTLSKQNPNENDIDTSIKSIFGNLHNVPKTAPEELETLLCSLTEQFVFTFPLRSIGPLQWSKSNRIDIRQREINYKEAEQRCEIIKYFLKNGEEFDKDKEQKYFRQLLLNESDDYNFKLDSDDKIRLSEGEFALLKTPEGILEAKAFSIIISSRKFKTILLEEPDRGMHPQFMQRMIQIMKEEKNNKKVILTTHQKGFVTPWTVPDIFVFRHSGKENQIISCKSILGDEKDVNMKKMRLLTSHHVPDILFAKKALFYEGDSEQLFLEELKSQILAGESSITSKLLNADNVVAANNQLKECLMDYTLIKMNSKDNCEFYTIVADNLKLDYLVVVDRDAVPGILGKNKPKDIRIHEREAAKSRSQAEWKVIRNSLMQSNHIIFWLDGSIEDMVTVMCDGNSDLKASLIKQKVIDKQDKTSHDGVRRSQIYGKKLFLHDCIDIGNVIESVRSILAHCNPDNDLADFINILAKQTL